MWSAVARHRFQISKSPRCWDVQRRSELKAASSHRTPKLLSLDAGAAAFHELLHFGEGCHRCVAWSGHSQRAMGRAVFDGFLRIATGHQTVNQTGSEAIAATDAVQD